MNVTIFGKVLWYHAVGLTACDIPVEDAHKENIIQFTCNKNY